MLIFEHKQTKLKLETKHPIEKVGELSMEQVIAAVKATRDLQIEELMKDEILMAFLEHIYDTIEISNVKKQFLLKDLSELKSSPLDLSHYSSLITQMKEAKILTVHGNHKLFLGELTCMSSNESGLFLREGSLI